MKYPFNIQWGWASGQGADYGRIIRNRADLKDMARRETTLSPGFIASATDQNLLQAIMDELEALTDEA